MKEEQNLVTAHANEPAEVLLFLSKYLNFSEEQELRIKQLAIQGVSVANKLGDDYLLVPGSALSSSMSNLNDFIIINTDDCLRDYHQLLKTGIKIEQTPRYTTRGLEVVFSDDHNNHYILLEKRDYSEM